MVKNFVSILLALMVAFTSNGVVINKHFCNAQLKNISLFVKTDSCHANETKEVSCCSKTSCQKSPTQTSDCCDNESELVKQNLENTNASSTNENVAWSLTGLATVVPKSVKENAQQFAPIKAKAPPLIAKIFRLFFGVFRI